MKTKIAIKEIRQNWKHVFYCGYGDLQFIFRHKEPTYYNCGVYGWNCDIYTNYGRDIAITTGYKNMAGKRIPYELIKKYEEEAKKITACHTNTYEEEKALFEELQEKFLDELLKI